MATAHEDPELSSEVVKKTGDMFMGWLLDDKPEKPLNVLMTGKTGVGKSRLVNALVGKKVANEGRKNPCTMELTSYEVTIENVKITVWDSPGLQDGTNKESEYIQDMKDKVKDIALMIYCVRMDETRFYEADKKAVKILTDEFGSDIWKHAVVALTFANRVDNPNGEEEEEKVKEYFLDELQAWKQQFEDYFVKDVGVNSEMRVPVIPAGNTKRSMSLPDRENWLSFIWTACYKVMTSSTRRGMYRINRNRLRFDDSVTLSNASALTFDENDIPCEIPLNNEHQRSFWQSTWEAFQHVHRAALPLAFGSAVLADVILTETSAGIVGLSIASGGTLVVISLACYGLYLLQQQR